MITVDYPSMTPVAGEPDQSPVNVPASLGALGYAAFALVQPIPLGEIVPFPMVVTAFEAEAARLAEPEPEPESEPEPAVVDVPLATPEFVGVPEPVVSYVEGGYRPSAPVMPSWQENHRASSQDKGDPAPAFEASGQADDTGSGEDAERAAESEPEPVLAIVVPGLADGVFPAGGYVRDGDSGESRARQVLNELSFLFDDA